jgi:hypothetical protein
LDILNITELEVLLGALSGVQRSPNDQGTIFRSKMFFLVRFEHIYLSIRGRMTIAVEANFA